MRKEHRGQPTEFGALYQQAADELGRVGFDEHSKNFGQLVQVKMVRDTWGRPAGLLVLLLRHLVGDAPRKGHMHLQHHAGQRLGEGGGAR